MNITVVLCTYNRSQTLTKALNSIVVQELPDSLEWEILVVDNNSTDQTREVVDDFCRRYPSRFRYCLQPIPGLSYARNAGIREANGEILVFTDDDVTVDSKWLLNLTASLHGGEWGGVGGKIVPANTFSPPRWLPPDDSKSFQGMFSLFDHGEYASELIQPPFGANMAFRKEMFEKYGGFRTDLGRRPDSMMSNEDTEFGRRLLLAGERLRYEPSAVVYHPVSENRMQKKYFLAWRFDKSRASMREFGIPAGTRWFVDGIPLFLVRRLLVWTLRWMISVRPAQRFSCKLKVWGIAGEIKECRLLSRRNKAHGHSSLAPEALHVASEPPRHKPVDLSH